MIELTDKAGFTFIINVNFIESIVPNYDELGHTFIRTKSQGTYLVKETIREILSRDVFESINYE